jgi:malate dehydrogenase
MAEAILTDSGATLTSSVYLEGQYGISETYCGVPASLGSPGVRKIVELNIGPEALEALHQSAADVKDNFKKLKWE